MPSCINKNRLNDALLKKSMNTPVCLHVRLYVFAKLADLCSPANFATPRPYLKRTAYSIDFDDFSSFEPSSMIRSNNNA